LYIQKLANFAEMKTPAEGNGAFVRVQRGQSSVRDLAKTSKASFTAIDAVVGAERDPVGAQLGRRQFDPIADSGVRASADVIFGIS
jgi:hypothetical protein